MATLHDLPPELLHTIFACMGHTERGPSSRGALVACSIVSRLWRDIALPYLFSTLKAGRRGPFANVIPFLDAHPHIAACVKRLWLEHAGVSPSKSGEVDYDTVSALLARLPALVNLSFHTVKFVGPRSLPSGPQPASQSSAIQTISSTDVHTCQLEGRNHNGPYRLGLVILYSCTAPDPTPLFRILSLCEMDTLRATLNELPGIDSAQVDPTALHRPLRVRWLRVAVQKRPTRITQLPPPLLEALRTAVEPGSIRAFDVTFYNWGEVASAGALLRNAGRNLTTLRLSVCWGSAEGDMAGERPGWGALALSSCPQLEMFEYSFPPFGSIFRDRSGNACAKLIELLPAGVRTIVLRLPELMHDAVSEYPRTPGLRKIEEVVLEGGRRRLPNLSRVVLSFVDYEVTKFETWATIGGKVLPGLMRERLLYAPACGR